MPGPDDGRRPQHGDLQPGVRLRGARAASRSISSRSETQDAVGHRPQRRVLVERHRVVGQRAVDHRGRHQHHPAYAGRGRRREHGLGPADVAARPLVPAARRPDVSTSRWTTASTLPSRPASAGSRTSSTRQVTPSTSPRRSSIADDLGDIGSAGQAARRPPRPRPEAAPVTATTGLRGCAVSERQARRPSAGELTGAAAGVGRSD